uniref:G_PROTEIN_RECEP_F1_2 domain-containing protein n=1 Tax=Dracunculus medinensis TaxID=318479 RepID=A0A0N4UBJ6_DRAME
LNIFILTNCQATKRLPSRNLLLALAICDCLFLLFATIEVTPLNLSNFITSTSMLNLLYIHSALYIRTIASTFYKFSILIVISFNIERYICICYPLYSYKFYAKYTNRLFLILSFIISLLFSLQWPICYKIEKCWDYLLQHEIYYIIISRSKYLQFYYNIMDSLTLLIFNLLSIIIVCILNIRIVITLKKINRRSNQNNSFSIFFYHQKRKDIAGKQTNNANANAMLFAVIILLVICVGPQAPARLLYKYYGQYNSIAIIYTCITQQLVFLNASLNFCLYCLLSRKYRSIILQFARKLYQKTFK